MAHFVSPADAKVWQQARDATKAFRNKDALALYQKLVKKNPHHGVLWYELGSSAKKMIDNVQASRAFRKARQYFDGNGKLAAYIAHGFASITMLDESQECFRTALKHDPSSLESLYSLIKSYEKSGKIDEARAYLEPFLQTQASDEHVMHLDAYLDYRGGNLERAESGIRAVIEKQPQNPQVLSTSHYILADILDKTERYDEAITCLQQYKLPVLQTEKMQNTLISYDLGVAERSKLFDSFSTALIEQWQRAADLSSDKEKQMTFLGGHPRSGTTLLERVLDSHPDITAFDEPDAFNKTADSFLRKFGPDHRGVATLPDYYRQQLFWQLGGEKPAKVIIDKNPSLTACLHSWLRVFPGMKTIIALRHPLDVMVSTYFLNVATNSLSCNFLSFERICKHYRDMMEIWIRLRDMGGFSWIESRYEDTVQDIHKEGARVTEFLGLTWDPSQAEFHTKKQQTHVGAPTYHDVTKPLHQKSVQRWMSYEKYLAPSIEDMKPFIREFGYE